MRLLEATGRGTTRRPWVGRLVVTGRADDPTFIDWKVRKRLSKLSKSQRSDAKMEIELRRMRSAHAPDMLELMSLFEETLRRHEAPRHFPRWSPRDLEADEKAHGQKGRGKPLVAGAPLASPLDAAIAAGYVAAWREALRRSFRLSTLSMCTRCRLLVVQYGDAAGQSRAVGDHVHTERHRLHCAVAANKEPADGTAAA